MARYHLTPAQQALYEEGGWAYNRLLRDVNDDLDRAGVHEPVALMAVDGTELEWLTAERR